MKWFKKLSTGNKIAFISLLLAVLTFTYSVYQKKDIQSESLQSSKTSGNNSPVVTNTGGDVTIKFNE